MENRGIIDLWIGWNLNASLCQNRPIAQDYSEQPKKLSAVREDGNGGERQRK